MNTTTITLSHDIQFIHGNSRSKSFHRLWTNETKAAFTIDAPGSIAAKWAVIDSLKKGDTLTIKYSAWQEKEVEDKSKEVPIYFLEKGDHLYFDTNAYNEANKAYDNRWNKLMLVGSVLLILRGLTIINSKTTYILAALSLATIIVLRILNKF